MEPISDPFEFEHVMELVRLGVAEMPFSLDVLEHRLHLLIDDAKSDLKGANIEIALMADDLDDANGVWHLITDSHRLTTNEHAAGKWLLAIYVARDQLDEWGKIEAEELDAIEATGWIVMAWRLWNSAHTLHERKTAAQRARLKWFRSQPEYSQVQDAAKRLLKAGTYRHNLVSELRRTEIGQEIERNTLQLMLRRQGLLPPRKKRKKKK